MKNIRPRKIFELVECKIKNKKSNFLIDFPPSEIGSLTLLESAILIAFIKCINAKTVFEFGTFFGNTTKNIAVNLPREGRIFSIDINKKQKIDLTQLDIKNKNFLKNEKINDLYLMNLYKTKGPKKIKSLDKTNKKKIFLINQNSQELNEKLYQNMFDLIFIDGGHDFQTIDSDTQKSLKMAKKNSIIFWHDYNSKIHKSVTKYLNKYALKKNLYYIENTMLAFQLNGRYSKLLK